MSAHDLVRSLSGSIVTADVIAPDGEQITGDLRVEPPSVRVALGVLASLQSGDNAFFARTVKEWLPPDLYRAYFESGFPADKAVRQIVDMLSVGHGKKEKYEADKEEVEESARSWHAIIADYRRTFLADPLPEPWSYFLSQYAEMLRLRRIDQMDMAESFLVAQSGDRDAFNRLRWDAYPEIRRFMGHDVSDQHRDEQLEKIRRMRQGGGHA